MEEPLIKAFNCADSLQQGSSKAAALSEILKGEEAEAQLCPIDTWLPRGEGTVAKQCPTTNPPHTHTPPSSPALF